MSPTCDRAAIDIHPPISFHTGRETANSIMKRQICPVLVKTQDQLGSIGAVAGIPFQKANPIRLPSLSMKPPYRPLTASFAIGLAALALLSPPRAGADTLTNSYSSGQVTGGQTGFLENGNSSGINGQYNFAIGFSQFTTQFNPTLGTLNSITITIGVSLSLPASANWQAFNAGQTGPGSFNHTASLNVALIDFGNNVLHGFSSGTNDGFSVPVSGSASQTMQLLGSETFILTDPTSLADFTVGGNAYPPQFNIGGNGVDNFTTIAATGGPGTPTAFFNDTIVFNYTPVPEPSVISLGLLGLATAVLLKRRNGSV